MDKVNDLLEVHILEEKKIMTYRLLSRELSIRPSEAKDLLSRYHSSHPDLHATYLLTGTLLPQTSQSQNMMDVDGEESQSQSQSQPTASTSKTQRTSMVLCVEKELTAKKEAFDESTLSTQIYSLSPSLLRDPAILVTTANLLQSHKAYHNPAVYGSFVSPSYTMSDAPPVASSSKKAAAAPAATSKGKPAEKEKAPVGGKNGKAAPAQKGTLDFSKARVKEPEVEKPKVEKVEKDLKRKASTLTSDSKPNTTAPAKSKRSPSPPPTKFIGKKKSSRAIESDEDEEDEEKVPARSTTASKAKPRTYTREEIEEQTRGLEGMFDDDDLDENGDEIVKPPPRPADSKKRAPIPSDSEEEGDEEAIPAPKSKTKAAPAAKGKGKAKASDVEESEGEAVRDEKGRKRKVRRVTKSVQTTNARGYKVTEDVSEEESYYTSDDASSAPPPPAKGKKAASATSKAKAAPARPPLPSKTSSESSSGATKASSSNISAAPAKKAPTGKNAPPPGQRSVASFFTRK